VDRCPTVAEDPDGYNDDDGCPDLDNDADDVPDTSDQCPNDPEDRDGFEETDGCPEFDNDQDGIPDMDDRCPNEKGQCVTRVEVTRDAIVVNDRLYFKEGTAVVEPGSYGLLDEIAAAITSNPAIAHLQIAAYTDSVGDDHANLKLSQARAEAIEAYFITRAGIDPDRLSSEGFGETKPIATDATPEGRERNRRVEFRIVRE
jgi:outer membrane protein OmpA-like peptidoglycan-associated protein